eukprot:g1913.t1
MQHHKDYKTGRSWHLSCSKNQTSLHYEMHTQSSTSTVYINFCPLIFGCAVADLKTIRTRSKELGADYLQMEGPTSLYQNRHVAAKILAEVFEQGKNSTPPNFGSKNYWVSWKQTLSRGRLSNQKCLQGQIFYSHVDGAGEDLISVRMFLECAQLRMQKARQYRKMDDDQCNAFGSLHVHLLLEPLVQIQGTFVISVRFGVKCMGPGPCGVTKTKFEEMVQAGAIHRDVLQQFKKQQKEVSWHQAVAWVTEWGSSSLLDEMATFTTNTMIKMIHPDSAIKLKGASAAQKKKARMALAHGHLIECMSQKITRCGQDREELFDTPIGFYSDGVREVGAELIQSVTRSNVYGTYADFPVPAMFEAKVTSKDLDAVIKRDFHCQQDAQVKKEVNSCLTQAALIQKLNKLLFVGEAFVDFGVFFGCDFGSAQRQIFLFYLVEGFKCHPWWDPPHRENRDHLACTAWLLPAALQRFVKWATVAGKSQRSKSGDLIGALMGADDQKLAELLSDFKDELEKHVGVPMTGGALNGFRKRLCDVRSSIPDFAQSKRWMKNAEAAEFASAHEMDLMFLFDTQVRIEKPELVGVGARQKLVPDKQFPKLVHRVHDSVDMTLVLKEFQEQVDARKLSMKDVRFNDFGSDDEEDTAEVKWSEREEVEERPSITEVLRGQVAAELAGDKSAKFQKAADGSKRPTETPKTAAEADLAAAIEKKQSEKEKADLENFVCVCWNLFRDPLSMAKIHIVARSMKVPLLFHHVNICATRINLMAQQSFYSMFPCMLSEMEKVRRLPLDQRCDRVSKLVDASILAGLYGRQWEAITAVYQATHRQRMARTQRILMYGLKGNTDLKVEDLKKMAPLQGGARSNVIRDILEDPEKYCGSDTGIMAALLPPYFYSMCLTDGTALTDERRDELGCGPILIPMHTSFSQTYLEAPAQYETRVARRIEFIRKNSTAPHAAALLRALLFSYKYHLVKKVTYLLFVGKYKDAEDLITKWNKANPRTTRPVEARGGKLTKAGQKANCSGVLAGNIPWHFYEVLSPQWLPWNKIRNPLGSIAGKGVKESFSALDGWQPMRLPDTEPGKVATVDQIEKHLWPRGRTFEANNPGLVDPTRFFEFCCMIEDGVVEGSSGHLMNVAQSWGEKENFQSKGPSQQEDALRKAIVSLCNLSKDDHQMTPETLAKFLDFSFEVGLLTHQMTAEFLADERTSFFTSTGPRVDRQMKSANLLCILAEGLIQKNRRVNRPTVLQVKDTKTHEKVCVQVYETQLLLNVIYCAHLRPLESFSAKQDAETDSDGDMSVAPTEKVNPDAMEVDGEDMRDFDLQDEVKGKALRHGSALGDFLMPKYKRTANDTKQMHLHPWMKPVAYSYPFPTTMRAKDSKQKALFMACDRIVDGVLPTAEGDVTIKVMTSARYQFSVTGSHEIVVPDPDENQAVLLEAALKNSLGIESVWVEGKNVAIKALLWDLCKQIVIEEPIRLRVLVDDDFIFERDRAAFDRRLKKEYATSSLAVPEKKAVEKQPIKYTPKMEEIIAEQQERMRQSPILYGKKMKPTHQDRDKYLQTLQKVMADKEKGKQGKHPLLQADKEFKEKQAVAKQIKQQAAKESEKEADKEAEKSARRALEDWEQNGLNLSEHTLEDVRLQFSERLVVDDIDYDSWAEIFQKIKLPKATMCTELLYATSSCWANATPRSFCAVALALKKTVAESADAAEKPKINILGGAGGDDKKTSVRKAPTQAQLKRNLDKMLAAGDPQAWKGEQGKEAATLVRLDGTAVPQEEIEQDLEVVDDGLGVFDEEEESVRRDEQDLREFFSKGDGLKQYNESKSKFWCQDVDLVTNHARDRRKVLAIHCIGCGTKKIGYGRRMWVTSQGPRFYFSLSNDMTCMNRSRVLGNTTHLIVDASKKQRFCGFWRDQKCWTKEDGGEQVSGHQMWKCSQIYAARRLAHESEWKVCNCDPPVDPKSLKTFKAAETYG